MKPLRRALAVAVLLTALPVVAWSDDYAGFRVPTHRFSSLILGLQGDGQTELQNTGPGTFRRGVWQGNASVNALWGFDSDRRQHVFGVNAHVTGASDHQEDVQTYPAFVSNHEGSVRNALEELGGFYATRLYPWQTPIGLEAFVSAVGRLQQSWSRSLSDGRSGPGRTVNASDEVGHFVEHDAAATLTLGYGRVRDATAVYARELLEQRLRATGAIERPLSAAARAQLARLFDVRSDFTDAHDFTEKWFWREVERIAREDGALRADGLDAWSVFRALEPSFPGFTFARPAGWFVGPSVQVRESRRHSRDRHHVRAESWFDDTLAFVADFDGSDHSRNRFDEVSVGGQVDYHRPLGMRWQTDATAGLLFIDARHGWLTHAAVDATWLVADRWLANAKVEQQAYAEGRSSPRPRQWLVTYGASLGYFLEDRWLVSLETVAQQNRDEGFFGAPFYGRRHIYRLGITHRVWGVLEAPGIIPIQRLSPPR